MRPRTVLAAIVAITAAAACVLLGFWQLSRYHEKRALNVASRAALARPPLEVAWPLPAPEDVRGRRVALEGRFDETRQILLTGRYERGEPGVDVVTPLLLAGDSVAVFVDRGWLYAVDGVSARPQDHREPGARRVLGVARRIEWPSAPAPARRSEADSMVLLSVRALDLETLATHFPYALAPFVVSELPGAGVPAAPRRRAPEPLDEGMHLGYAIQWFAFAVIIVAGSVTLAWSRRRKGG